MESDPLLGAGAFMIVKISGERSRDLSANRKAAMTFDFEDSLMPARSASLSRSVPA
jgi:hypothetical protein